MNQPLPKKTLLILAGVVVIVSVSSAYLLLVPKTPPEEVPLSFSQKLHFLLAPLRHFKTTTVQEQALAALEKNLQFCQVVNQKDLPEGKKEFQLICNGRPFSALWENEKISYELNGWSFLKEQPEVLKELQENHCRLYQATDDHNLSFVCEKDEMVRKYTFSTPGFKLVKQKEELFLNEIFQESWRAKIFPCDLNNAMGVGWEDESLIELTMNCRDYKTKLYFNFNKTSFTLPVVVDEGLSNEEKVQQSLTLLNLYFCNLESIKGTDERRFFVRLDCPETGELMIDYDLNLGMANFLFNKKEFDSFFYRVIGYIFPFLEEGEVKSLVSYHDEISWYSYYQADNQVITVQRLKESNFITEVYLKDEGLNP